MIYVGLDMSINSPGLTIIDGETIEHHFRFDFPKRKKITLPENFFPKETCDKSQEDMVRYIDNAEWIISCINGREAVVVIEGYAFGATGSRIFNIAENCAVTKYRLFQEKIPVFIYTPGTIKKFATKNGAAKKGLMVDRYEKETGNDLYEIFQKNNPDSPLSDIADSYFMAKYAQTFHRTTEQLV